MTPTHQDNHASNHPFRLADPAVPAPSPSSNPPPADRDRGILLEALFLAALMLLCAVSTVWGWLA